jgi:hypothetical protein
VTRLSRKSFVVSYEATSITPPNHWRELYAAALSLSPYIIGFALELAVLAAIGVIR